MSDESVQRRRNACLQLVRVSNRNINGIRFGENESDIHKDTKERECLRLLDEGKHFVCEAIFADGSGRTDILILDDFVAREVVASEKEASIVAKKNKYPNGLKVEVVRCY